MQWNEKWITQALKQARCFTPASRRLHTPVTHAEHRKFASFLFHAYREKLNLTGLILSHMCILDLVMRSARLRLDWISIACPHRRSMLTTTRHISHSSRERPSLMQTLESDAHTLIFYILFVETPDAELIKIKEPPFSILVRILQRTNKKDHNRPSCWFFIIYLSRVAVFPFSIDLHWRGSSCGPSQSVTFSASKICILFMHFCGKWHTRVSLHLTGTYTGGCDRHPFQPLWVYPKERSFG